MIGLRVCICGCGEMADALALGASVHDVGVQVPSSAPKNTAEWYTSAVFFYPSRRLGISSPQGVYHHALACISSPKVYSSAT